MATTSTFRLHVLVCLLICIKAQTYGPSLTTDHFQTSTGFDVYFNETFDANAPELKIVTVDLPLYGGLLVEKKFENFTLVGAKAKNNQNASTIRARLHKINPAPGGKLFRVATLLVWEGWAPPGVVIPFRSLITFQEPPFVTYYNMSDEARKGQRTGPGIVIEILGAMQKLHNFQ